LSGATLTQNQATVITWKTWYNHATNLYVKIDLYRKGGAKVMNIHPGVLMANPNTTNVGAYSWVVPTTVPPSNDYYIVLEYEERRNEYGHHPEQQPHKRNAELLHHKRSTGGLAASIAKFGYGKIER
jgi:hypothetical protein